MPISRARVKLVMRRPAAAIFTMCLIHLMDRFKLKCVFWVEYSHMVPCPVLSDPNAVFFRNRSKSYTNPTRAVFSIQCKRARAEKVAPRVDGHV